MEPMARPRSSGLTEEQREALAEHCRRYLPQFDNNHTRMASAWKISQPQLSQILNPTDSARGAGIQVLVRIRAATGLSLDELLGLPPLGLSLDERIQRAVDQRVDERVDEVVSRMAAVTDDVPRRPRPRRP